MFNVYLEYKNNIWYVYTKNSPFFCFSRNTKDEVVELAKQTIDYYNTNSDSYIAEYQFVETNSSTELKYVG